MPTLLYLHGFNSSPESKKALQTEQWFANYAPDIEFVCPQLPPFANQAMELLSRLIEQRLPDPVYLVGSSMGGFLANCLVERYGVKAVLINPAVSPHRGLEDWLGENANYQTGETWRFEPEHIDEYKQWDPTAIKQTNNYLVLLQSGDEILDYRDAQQHYNGCKVILEYGGDHSFTDYDRHLENIHHFLLST